MAINSMVNLLIATNAPAPADAKVVTAPLTPPSTVLGQLANFPEEVYSLDPQSHLVRLMSALLGDSGVGGVRKQMLMTRLQNALQGSHFFDLDGFYGALFGVTREVDEIITVDPGGIATIAEWDAARASDASYRSKIAGFGRAIERGATPVGVMMLAEAILGVECDLYESWVQNDITGAGPRNIFTILPHRQITQDEAYTLRRVINRLKPANTSFVVDVAGPFVHTPIELRGVGADSEYWTIRSIVSAQPVNGISVYSTPGTDNTPFVEQPQPPFSDYVGEWWWYNADVAGTSSYALSPDLSLIVVPSDYQRVTFFDGSYKDYLPQLAISSSQLLWASELVADGRMVINALERSNSRGVATPPSLMMAGIPIEKLLSIWNDPNITPNILLDKSGDQFWSTAPQLPSWNNNEALEVRLHTPKLVNRLKFDLPVFPHTAMIQYKDANSNWQTLWKTTITNSWPAQFKNLVDHLDHLHPQHRGAGHWQSFDIRVPTTSAAQWRIVVARIFGYGPFDQAGLPVAYALGVRNFSVGYEVVSLEDVPLAPASSEIATSTDVMGNQTKYSLVSYPASGLLASPAQQWKCAPQPALDAVVNFYLDTRDAFGNAQAIDQIYIDPLFVGPSIHLYYSNDQPLSGGSFNADDTPLADPVVQPTGSVTASPTGLTFGDIASCLDISNQALQFNPNSSWWVGASFRMPAASTAPGGTVLDLGVLEGPGGDIGKLVASGGMVGWVPASWNAGDTLTVALVRTAQPSVDFYAGAFLFVAVNGVPVAASGSGIPLGAPNVPPVLKIRLGCSLNASDGIPGLVLESLVLKQELPEAGLLTQFLADPTLFTIKPADRTQGQASTGNALLRFDPSFYSTLSPFGLLGGPPEFWGNLRWTPIPRDYRAEKGYLYLPPTMARFWKLEFTDLVAEPFEVLRPGTTTYQAMPEGQTKAAPTANGSTLTGDTATLARFATVVPFYTDDVVYTSVSPPPPSQTYSPTAIAIDPSQVVTPASSGQIAGFLGGPQPLFNIVRQHNYAQAEASTDQKVAFFCGLNAIEAIRADYTAENDAVQYLDNFVDTHNIIGLGSLYGAASFAPRSLVSRVVAPFLDDGSVYRAPTPNPIGGSLGAWQLNPGDLFTTEADSVAESNIFQSTDDVYALQFATQQTDAPQLIPDPNFDDPHLSLYGWNDDTSWREVGSDVTFEWDDVMASGVFMSRLSASAAETGGVISPSVPVSDRGRIYAAVRFTAVTSLTSPLILQIIASDGTTVLAQKTLNAQAGQTVESYIGYTIGQVPPVPPFGGSLLSRTLVSRVVHPVLTDTTAYVPPVGPPPVPASDGAVSVRLIQNGVSADTWKLESLALFDQSLVWEFSVDGGATWYQALDIRNNPNGVLTFPNPGNQLRWRLTGTRPGLHVHSLQIRPWYRSRKTVRSNTDLQRGPNVTLYDTVPPITEDPMFTTWSVPVPYPWWLVSRRFPVLNPPGYPDVTQYALFFARSASTSVPAPSGTATRWQFEPRSVSNPLSLSTAVARALQLVRSQTTTLPAVTTSAVATVHPIHPSMVRRLIAPVLGDMNDDSNV